jgi:NADH dehydrogenase [ubiquinone] 1 alpha subcomplex assembly factor 1
MRAQWIPSLFSLDLSPPVPPTVLFDFTAPSPDAPADWRSIDDPVMGGLSESEFVDTDEGAAFTGTVSLKQGGGFASVRAPESTYDLSGHAELRLRLRGDGKRYWVTAYTEAGGAISYRAPIQPPGHWTTVTVPFGTLTPYRRGTRAPHAPPLDPAQLRTLGFLIADEQEGSFRLEVGWIRPGQDEPSS